MRKTVSLVLVIVMLLNISVVSFAAKKEDDFVSKRTIWVDEFTSEFEQLGENDIAIIYEGVPILKSDIVDGKFEVEETGISIESLPDMYRLPYNAKAADVIMEIDTPQYQQTTSYGYMVESQADAAVTDLLNGVTTNSWVWNLVGLVLCVVKAPAIGLIAFYNGMSTSVRIQLATDINNINGDCVIKEVRSDYVTLRDVYSWDGEYVNLTPESPTEELQSFTYGY